MSRKTGFFLFIVILALGAVAYYLSRTPGPSPPQESTLAGVTVRGYGSNGKPSWEVRAQQGKTETDGGELEDVVIVLHGDNEVTLKAARLSFHGDRARLSGGVEARLGKDGVLRADELVWKKDTGDLSGEEVRITFAAGSVAAQGFSYSPKSGTLSLTGGVEAEIHDPKVIHASAPAAVYADGRVELSEGVEITAGGERYRCASARYGNGKVVLSGGVEGTLSSGPSAAEEITVDEAGTVASSKVELRLGSEFFGGKDGA